ncbi:unnamed protein product [Phytomonas sp. EM1]|nr:unnamed protein product [Phytomonas sp. EM1]|eukprot:CCW62795.1 unnamed protein product [Phytomonas sp. isolate EM1]
MPFFGVDDVLLLLASTTAVLWAKRADIVQASVYRAVNFMTHSPILASKYANEAARNHHEPPLLLLKGFDLQTARKSVGPTDFFKRLPALASDGLRPSRMSYDEPRKGLVRTSLVNEYSECSATHEVPDVPHRRYNPYKSNPNVTALIDYSEEEVAENIRRYSVAAVHSLFTKMESEANWEAVIRVSRGIDRAQLRLRYLTKSNVEAALRVLISCATSTSEPAIRSDFPLTYYFTFAEDMLLDDGIIIALFDLSRYSEAASIELYKSLLPFQAEWSPAVYACSLTTTARFSYDKTLKLYEEYLQAQRRGAWTSNALLRPIKQALVSSSVMQEDESLPSRDVEAIRLQYLYHIMIPLVVARDPARAKQFIADMLAHDPESAPDVFLKCLANDIGKEFAETYLKKTLAKKNGGADGALLNLNHSCEGGSSQIKTDRCALAYSLYTLKPSVMNLNSLLKVILRAEAMEGSAIRSLPQSWGRGVFESVPLTSSQEALILARSITEHPASHAVAEVFLEAMMLRKQFVVVPILAFHVASQGRWATASRAMAIYLSNQRGRFSQEEISLCVEAAVYEGNWSSALFWVERAHAKGLKLPVRIYDTAFSVSPHWSWKAAWQVVKDMRAVGGVCSNDGVLHLLQAATEQGATAEVLRELSGASGVD